MLAIIPAKKNSSRLKNKNIKRLNKKPLIAYSIEAALSSKLITRVIVSTDSKKISIIAKKYGAEVPFIRPKNLCLSGTSLKDVCKHAVKYLEKRDRTKINEVIALQPTSPLRTSLDIDNSIRIFKNKKANFLTSITKAKPIEWNCYIKKNMSIFKIIKKKMTNSQKSKQNFVLNGAIYIYTKKNLYDKSFFNKKSYSYIMPRNRSVDIDELDEFKFAQYILLNQNL